MHRHDRQNAITLPAEVGEGEVGEIRELGHHRSSEFVFRRGREKRRTAAAAGHVMQCAEELNEKSASHERGAVSREQVVGRVRGRA